MSGSEFRIEKVRRAVVLTLSDGSALEGDVFLQPTARYRAGAQEPAELFNEPEPFVPVAMADRSLVLVAKSQVYRVQFAADAADTPMGGVEAEAAVDVVFPDGSVAGGALRLETRAERSRLLDFLNDEQQAFITLRSSFGITLINRRHIVQVRQRR